MINLKKDKEKSYVRIWKKINKKSDGFTFVETLAVLAIGTVLSAGCYFSASKLVSIAKKASAESQIKQYSAALQIYFLDCGSFPTTEQGLLALWKKPILYPIPEKWAGPYIESKPTFDPWGSEYEYISAESSELPTDVPQNLPFVLISYGEDKVKGGVGDANDICSWE